ncbi:MAG: VPLPA-CTERM sorting domain-containing protein [Pseudomonadota bacterium]
MLSKTSLLAAFFSCALVTGAHAVPMTVGGVDFDTDNAASDVLWAQGGVFAGNPGNIREACADPTDRTSTLGPTGEICRAAEVEGFNLDEFVELDENNTVTQDPDVIAVFFDEQLVNGDGFDLIIWESADQSDDPSVSVVLDGAEITGTVIANLEVDGKDFTVTAFDFSDSPLNFALGALIGEPIFIRTFNQVGSSDIAAVVGINFDVPVDEIPLPAALPLFLAGIGGLAFGGRRKRA